MSNNKALVCSCCKKSYQMPSNIVPTTVAPWTVYGICEACDSVVINGRLLNLCSELSQFIGDQFDNPSVDEITEITLSEPTKIEPQPKVRTPRKTKTMHEQEVTPPMKALPVLPKEFTPAAKAQLSLFDSVINMANALF